MKLSNQVTQLLKEAGELAPGSGVVNGSVGDLHGGDLKKPFGLVNPLSDYKLCPKCGKKVKKDEQCNCSSNANDKVN
jgi:hypothetical protein